jgi:hypothetical protein
MALIVFIEIRNWFERRQLLDRIMAKNYEEFASHESLRDSLTAKVEKRIKRHETIPL